ncbi:MAG: sigma-54 interaction domain-containing protein [Myxococcales bacterium]
MIGALASEEPLAQRMLQVRSRPDREQAIHQVSCSVLAALLGDAHESEVALIRARAEGRRDLEFLIELSWAFTFVETGRNAARAAVHLGRAQEELPASGDPAGEALLLLLQAQALTAERRPEGAREIAAEGQRSIPHGEEYAALRAYASTVCATLALDASDPDAAERELSSVAAVRSGILAARSDVLRARLRFVRGGDPRESALDLDKAINSLTLLGAMRDLGLAYLERALQAGRDPGGAPGRWLARAQTQLANVGGPTDLQAIRRAWSALEHRISDLGEAGANPIRRLRERQTEIKGVVRDCAPCLEISKCEINSSLEGAVAALSQAEDHLSGALEHSMADRTRMGQLAAATHELASIFEYEELLVAIPRLALVVSAAAGAQLVRTTEDSLEILGASGADVSLRGEALARRVLDAFSANGSPVREGRESIAVVPVGPREGGFALVVECHSPGAIIGERDLEQLAVYASFANVSLVRASGRAALREAAARDAATLAAIGDGVLATDRSGTVRALNQAAATAMGVKREEAVGRRLRDLPGLSALAYALAGAPSGVEVVPLPRGEVVVRRHGYEGGVVAILRDLATEHTIAKRVVGSMARFTFDRLIGEDPAFADVVETARRAAGSDLPVLITGESGTGKELLAQAIHNASGRASAPFLGVNVTAIPRELVESELFGYEGGTFTGARSGGMAGKFELAGRGTLLLDELGDMPLEIQGKLLRVLQERVVQRLGSVSDVQVKARVIATTHRNLEEAVSEGKFRLDLYHRLRVVHLRIPPLRERKSDILLLAEHQLRMHSENARRRTIKLSADVADALEAYDWPGNVRELCNVIESEASLLPPEEDVISRVPRSLLQSPSRPIERAPSTDGVHTLEEVERQACAQALQHHSGNVARAAQALGVAKTTLYAKMKRYGLSEMVEKREPPARLQPSPARGSPVRRLATVGGD